MNLDAQEEQRNEDETSREIGRQVLAQFGFTPMTWPLPPLPRSTSQAEINSE